jgi:ribosomal protein L17
VLLAGAKLDEYEYLSNLVNHRYLFYILSQERTQDFESMIPKWAKKIAVMDSSSSQQEIAEETKTVSDVLISLDEIDVLHQKVLSYRYGKDTRKVRMILALIVKHYQERAGYDNLTLKQILKGFKAGSGFDIDHILPQAKILGQRNINAEDLDLETNRVQNVYQSIGNLVLVNGLQRVYSDKDPIDKSDLYKQDQSIFAQALSTGPHTEDPLMSGIIQEIRDSNTEEIIERKCTTWNGTDSLEVEVDSSFFKSEPVSFPAYTPPLRIIEK